MNSLYLCDTLLAHPYDVVAAHMDDLRRRSQRLKEKPQTVKSHD